MVAVRRTEGGPPGDPDEIYALLHELNAEAMVCMGFEVAYIGPTVAEKPVAVYDYDACIEIIMDKSDIKEDDATAYFYYNTLMHCVGRNSPVFVRCRPW